MNSLRLISIVLTLTYVTGASLNPICQVPNDLHIHYEKLAKEMNGFAFLTLTSKIQQLPNSNQSNQPTTCPTKLLDNGTTSTRSTCPWYNAQYHNDELFPSNWTEAACICKQCIGFNNEFSCEPVLTKALFLKRSKCADGLYVYKVYEKQIKTGCACAKKSTFRNKM